MSEKNFVFEPKPITFVPSIKSIQDFLEEDSSDFIDYCLACQSQAVRDYLAYRDESFVEWVTNGGRCC